MYQNKDKVGNWILDEKLSSGKFYSTFKAHLENSDSPSVLKIIHSDNFNESDFSEMKTIQDQIPDSQKLFAAEADGDFIFHRPWLETSVEDYLSRQRPRASKAVQLLQEILDNLILLEEKGVTPKSLSIGNLMIAADGKVILSDLMFRESLYKAVSNDDENAKESTVAAFSGLACALCCGRNSVELNLRDEIPSGLEPLLQLLAESSSDTVTLEWILDKIKEIDKGTIELPISLPAISASVEISDVLPEADLPGKLAETPKNEKTVIKAPSKQAGKKPAKKKSNIAYPVILAVLGIVIAILVWNRFPPGSSENTGEMGAAGEEPVTEESTGETVNKTSAKPKFVAAATESVMVKPRKPVVRPKLDLTSVKSKLPTGMPHDFLKGDKIPKDATHDWNLGPTGARGWIYSHKMETVEARQISVVKIAKNSPADGALELGDVILGVEEQLFSYDPRVEFGKAIGEVEGHDGNLSLIISRNGEISRVELQLPVLGFYSHTAPFNCSKSQKIFEKGCEIIAERLKTNAKKGHLITQSMNLLALLASGKSEYYPIVKKELEVIANSNLKRGYYSWHYGPVNILVAEYIMATGDKSLLPQLNRITGEIIDGQSPIGTWGHRFVDDTGRLMGYGMMNCPGVPMGTSLILAREAGAINPKLDEAIRKTTSMLRFYVGKGSIPYGDHHPWIQTHDDNGKNGAAAVMFNVMGDKEASKFFSRMSVASHGIERETGHTGNFFNMLWAMPGVAISGPNASGAWMEEYGWYYDLARNWDGSFVHQGPAEPRPDRYRNWDSTGAYMMAYGQMLKNLRLTGKTNKHTPISRSEAKSLIEDGRDWTVKLKHKAYAKRSDKEVLDGLRSWSPVVRERSALSLADRSGDYVQTLISMLNESDLYTRIGACQALAKLKGKSEPAIQALRKTLKADDLWLRIKASEALAAIGQPAMVAVPQLLEMMSHQDKSDPRGMQQRYLCFALFNRGGLIGKSLEGVDLNQLIEAVKIGLANEDGRARGAISSIYKKLTFEQLKPLLPAIKAAIDEPAKSGVMFCSEIRTAGLELFAKHKISEGLHMAANYIRYQKAHGNAKRIPKVLKIIESYGIHAKKVTALLESHARFFEKERGGKDKAKLIRDSIQRIEKLTKKPELINL